jgi:hypothetical protein
MILVPQVYRDTELELWAVVLIKISTVQCFMMFKSKQGFRDIAMRIHLFHHPPGKVV